MLTHIPITTDFDILCTNLQVFEVVDDNSPKMLELCLVLNRTLLHRIHLKFHCAKVLRFYR